MRTVRKRLARWMVRRAVPTVFPRLNPAFRWLLKSRLHPLADWYVVLLRFQGLRTGRRYEVPIAYHRVSATVLEAVTSVGGRWWRNLRSGDEITVVYKGRERSARIEILDDDAAVAAALRSRDVIRRALMPVPPGETSVIRVRLS